MVRELLFNTTIWRKQMVVWQDYEQKGKWPVVSKNCKVDGCLVWLITKRMQIGYSFRITVLSPLFYKIVFPMLLYLSFLQSGLSTAVLFVDRSLCSCYCRFLLFANAHMTVESRVETRVQVLDPTSAAAVYNFQQQESCRGAAVCLAHVTPGQDNVGQAWEKGQCMAYTSPQDALLRCSRMSLNTWYNYIFVFENIASNASSDLICQLCRHTVDYTQSCRAVRHKQQTEKPLELT